MFEDINIEYIILLVLVGGLTYYIYKEGSVMEGLTTKKDKKKSKKDDSKKPKKDPQLKDYGKDLKERSAACKDSFKAHVVEFLDEVGGIFSNMEGDNYDKKNVQLACYMLDPAIMDDEMYDGTIKSINTVYNTACKAILLYQLDVTWLLIQMATSKKTVPSPWNGYSGSKTSQNDLIHFNQTLEALFNIKKLCSESMAYLKEGDTLDAHQMHTFSMNADSTKGSASTTSTSSGITNKPATKPGLKKPPPPKKPSWI